MFSPQALALIHDLIINVSVLLSMTVCYSYARPLLFRTRAWLHPFIKGAIFGLFGVIVMSSPLTVVPGVFFDGRSLMIGLAGAFGGLRASLVAAVMIIVVRLSLGGVGAPNAVAAALTTVALTYWLLGRGRRRDYPTFMARQLLGLGFGIGAIVNFWTMLVSPQVAQAVASTVALPMLLLFPPAMLLIGRVLSNQNQRFELEAALKASDELFRQMAESVQNVVWIKDCQSNRVLYVSPTYERLTGRSANRLYRDAGDFLTPVHPQDRDRVLAAAARHTRGGFNEEFRYLLPDGSVRWVAAQTHPVRDHRGEVYRVAGVAEDITERKAAEAQKLELEIERTRVAMLRDFIANASHDLGTPLSVMQTSLYLLGRVATEPRQQGYVGRLQQQADRMQAMIENMLTLTRLDAASAERELISTDINALVELAAAPSRSRAEEKQQPLIISLDPTVPRALCDPAEVELAIAHVLNNAINFTPTGKPIEIRTRCTGDAVVIEVRDQGIGIPEAELSHIFERFYRVDQARGADTGGSGLGLAIAQKAVEFSDGRIDVESRVGAGSTFRITLRAAPAGEPASEALLPTR